jgi:TRAP-type C4-dicarboxylate transport system substrate-binding protein
MMKMKFSGRFLTFLPFFLVLFFIFTETQAQTVRLKLATAYSADNFQTQNIQQFSGDVKTATAGLVDIEVHPAGELLKPAAIFDGVKLGDTAQAGEVIMSNLTKENVVFGLDSLPFFVNNYEDAQRLWRLSRPAIEKAFDARGLVVLYAVPWPPQNLYANRPITAPQDFKGLRMRNYSSATERIAQIVGATPVKIEVLDLANAIADKKIDLMLTSSWTGGDTRAWTGMKYYYKVNAWIPKNIVFINKAMFAKFDADTQKKIMVAAAQAEKRGWQLCREKDNEFEAQLVSHNMQVSGIDPYVRNFLDSAGEKLAREYLKNGAPEDAQALAQILVQYTLERAR